LGIGYLSTGALLREHVDNATPLGRIAEPILARGGYVPDNVMCDALDGWLQRQSHGWVLDGFPRSLPQAEFLDGWLADKELEIDTVLLLEASYDELVSRIRGRVECPDCRWSGQKSQTLEDGLCPACGTATGTRSDDTEENFAARHREYLHHTTPVIDHYRERGLLIACDVTPPRDEVTAKLLRQLTSS
jgi:adenylate kinase